MMPPKSERNSKDDRSLKGWSDIILNSVRTPEQQRTNMFETMNEAENKKDSKFELTFTEIQDKAIKEGTKDGKIFQRMKEQAELMNKELCLLCDKQRDVDMRGFITIHDRDGKIYKVHYECVLKLIKEKLFG